MDAAQALADLTEISSQIQGAVLAETDGKLVASTFSGDEPGERVARAALELLRAAGETRPGDAELSHVQAATPEGSVFLVRDGARFVVAVTGADPTVGLVFYDLKTCLRLAAEEPPKKPRRARKKADARPGAGAEEPAGKAADA